MQSIFPITGMRNQQKKIWEIHQCLEINPEKNLITCRSEMKSQGKSKCFTLNEDKNAPGCMG